MSFDDPKAYHRQWKAKHDGSAGTFALGCLSLSLLFPGGAAIVGILLFIIYGTTAGFILMCALIIAGAVWLYKSTNDSSRNKNQQKLQELALRSLESNVCPNCGKYAFPSDTGEDGWWRCRECKVEISPNGIAQFRNS
ncbi:MAG: hypothetical protein KDA31_10475 [Phycisphaerales bacterium]|nr:hypothetical protein [Phycisphaerales bacterium]MCB9836628.1 hypothetical protein [Phycisphaera sp.]